MSLRGVRHRDASIASPYVEAAGWRRWLHVAIAVSGWALFGYWWWIVAHRTSQREVALSAVFLAVTLVLVLGTTGFWVLHNRGIHRRKGARQTPPPESPEATQDALGRPLLCEGGAETLRGAGFVRVVVGERDKRNRAVGS